MRIVSGVHVCEEFINGSFLVLNFKIEYYSFWLFEVDHFDENGMNVRGLTRCCVEKEVSKELNPPRVSKTNKYKILKPITNIK